MSVTDQVKQVSVKTHCKVTPIDGSSVLAQHVFQLNSTPLIDQYQIPNITMIEYDVEADSESDEQKQECIKVVKKQAVVFTSHLTPVQQTDTVFNMDNEEYNSMHQF